MDQPSNRRLGYDPDRLNMVLHAGWLPPTEEYQTVITHFPGNNVHPPWAPLGTKAHFFASVCLYQENRLMAKLHSTYCDETGCIRIDVDDAVRHLPSFSGMIQIEYHHEKSVPVEVYTAHIHRATGTYFACNISNIVGFDLYPANRMSHMDNVMFMPGLAWDGRTETSVLMLNPLKVKTSFQIHLFLGDGSRQQSDMLELHPMDVKFFDLESLFPSAVAKAGELTGRISLCVTSQFKQLSYLVQRDRSTGIATTLDHMHSYVLQ
jgi:hypothetical protein